MDELVSEASFNFLEPTSMALSPKQWLQRRKKVTSLPPDSKQRFHQQASDLLSKYGHLQSSAVSQTSSPDSEKSSKKE